MKRIMRNKSRTTNYRTQKPLVNSVFVLVFVFLFAPGLWAQKEVKYQYTLRQCVNYALENHATIKNMRLEEAINHYKSQELLAMGYPQVNADVRYSYAIKLPVTIVPASAFVPKALIGTPFDPKYKSTDVMELTFGVPHSLTTTLTVNQLVFDGSFFIGVKAAKEYVNLAKLNTKRNEVDVVASVAKAYYSVLVNSQRLQLLNNNIDQLRKSIKDLQVMKDNGFAEQLDVDRLTVTLNNLETELDKNQQLIEVSYALLKFQMGMDPNASLTLNDRLNADDLNRVFMDTLLTPEYHNRIEYKVLLKSVEMQQYNFERLRAQYYPSMYATFNAGINAPRQKFSYFDIKQRWFPQSYVGFQLNVPIFNGLKTNAQMQQAKLEKLKLKNQIDQFEQSVALEYKNARTSMSNIVRTLNIQKRNLDLAQEVLRVSRIKLKEGVGSNQDVVLAENEVKNATTNYMNTLLEAYLTRVDLQKAIGTLHNFDTPTE